jgi:cellulose synthase/poly-beta-1,6-N-acetylglucosamine synthase-like glycosyltransferase
LGAFISSLLAIVAGLFAIPVGIFLLEVIAAVLLAQRIFPPRSTIDLRRRVAVLVPAHNESKGLLPTLEDIKRQLRVNDRLLVVADNCTDDTAAVAAAAGAEVVVRADFEKIGKGYALDWGIRSLNADPPDNVIIIDADCRVEDNAIDLLSTASTLTGRPVQALYLMNAPGQSTINYQMAAFAWRVKNWVRPLGLSALGLPCQLMGTGMAFPWTIIESAKLESGQIVEDLNLGLDLAMAGSAPIFCPSAQVTSQFPISVEAADRQRQRWEHGHIDMILTRGARLIIAAITSRNLGLLALALDMAVPPLVLLGLLTMGMLLLATLAAWLIGSFGALIIGLGSFVALIIAVFLSWAKFARDILPPHAMWSVVPYALRKLDFYWRFLSGGRVSRWTRTDRK